MKFLGLGLFLISCSVFASSAPVTRPDPAGDYTHVDSWESDAAMIKDARTGRLRFMDVVYHIKNNARPFSSKERVFEYIMLLDDLRQIEIDLKFPVFQDSPVQSMGAFIVNSVYKEIDFTTDSLELIKKCFFWAKVESRYEIIQVQSAIVKAKSLPYEKLVKIFEVVSEVVDFLIEVEEANFLVESAIQLQNLIFEDLISYEATRDPETLPEMLVRLKNTEGIMVVLRKITKEVTLLKNDDEILAFMKLLEQLQYRISQLPSRTDDELKSSISDLYNQIAIKALEKFITIETVEYENLLQSLVPRDMLALYNKLIGLNLESMTESQIKTATYFSQFTFEFLNNNNYPELLPNLQKIYSQLSMLSYLTNGNLEGVYELQSTDNLNTKPYQMMIARSNIAEIVVSIIDSNKKHRASVAYSKYNLNTESIEIASHLDLESTANPDQPKLYQQVSLKKLESGNYSVEFYDGLNAYSFVSKKIAEAPITIGNKISEKSLKVLNGVFVAQYSKNTALRLRMIVDSSNNIKNVFDLISCQTSADTVFYMVLPYFFFLSDINAIEFTDRSLGGSNPFRQIRLAYENNNKLVGYYTSGSMASYKPMSFERVVPTTTPKEICRAVGL